MPPKARTHRARKALASREPKLIENPKRTMFLRGNKTSTVGTMLMRELAVLRADLAVRLVKKNPIHPFENASSLEYLSDKNDASTFVMVNHAKKRPDNVVFGRTFDSRILNMIEFGIQNFSSMFQIKSNTIAQATPGSKPSFLFQGPEWDYSYELKTFRNMIVDMFRGADLHEVNLLLVDRVIVCSALSSERIAWRHYSINFVKSESKVPRAQLVEIGPRFELVLRRFHHAPPDMEREAFRVPRSLQPRTTKNVSTSSQGEKFGRVHVEKEDLKTLALRRMKAFKRASRTEKRLDRKRSAETEVESSEGGLKRRHQRHSAKTE